MTDVGAHFPHRVTYHPTCHSLRMMHVGDAPLRLLRAVGGIDLVDLPDAETCCGFGGTFAVKNPDVSAAMCADKVSAIRQSRAEVVCAGDNSCLMHIGGALSRQRTGVRTMHLAEILASTGARRDDRRHRRGRRRGAGPDPVGTMPTYLGMPSFPHAAQGSGGRLPAPPEPHPRHDDDQDQARERGRRA